MSKYIKLEDAIHAIAENMAKEANLKTHCNEPIFCAGEFLVEAEMSVKDLPTIEVSNDCISKEWLVKALKKVSSESEDPRGFNEAIRFIKSAPSVVSSTVIKAERNTTQRNYIFYPEGNISFYKLRFLKTPHFTLCHPLIKQTVENMGFENIIGNPYMPYDKANDEGELWVQNTTNGVVEMKVVRIPKDWSDEE